MDSCSGNDMLAAFKPRPLVEFKPRDKSKIESILATGDRLLVGLNNGNLRVYRINEAVHENGDQQRTTPPPTTGEESQNGTGEQSNDNVPKTPPKPTDLLRELERFSRYKIEQLAVIKEAKLLVSLSGGYVSIHDLQTYELQEQLTRTKGATSFAVTSNIVNDPDTGVPSIVSRLAVAVKRKIMLWTWQDMELSPDTAEITLVSGVKTLTWVSGTKLVAGLSSNYVLVDIQSMESKDIVGPGSIGGGTGHESSRLGGVGVASMSYIGMGGGGPKPLATRLNEGQVLLARDLDTHFIDSEGNSLNKKPIKWSQAPDALGYSYPYLLALQDSSKGVLEVRNPDTLSRVQSISLPSATILHIPQPNISLAHAGKDFLVASDRTIWRMETLSYDDQVDSLLENGHLDEAISLISMLEDVLLTNKPGRLREAQLQKAQQLFNARRYRQALDLFAEVCAPPEVVIQLYPKIIAGDLSSFVEEDQSADGEEEAVKTTPPAEESPTIYKTASYAPSLTSFLRGKSDDNSEAGSMRGKPTESIQTDKRLGRFCSFLFEAPKLTLRLEGKDLKNAVRELQGYLADVRRRFQRFIHPDGTLKPGSLHANGGMDEFENSVRMLLGLSKDAEDSVFEERLRENAKLVDTTLFRAHMYATPSLAGSLFRIANFCDPDVVMEKLEETGRHNELIDFYFGKKMHRRALELLQKFGQAPPPSEGDNEGDQKPDTDAHLRGPGRTVAYLQHLPPDAIDLILEFAEWPLRTDPDLGMEIFLADTENAETLPRQRVTDFLQGIDPRLAVRYLEHVIDELNDLTPDLHQRLLLLYFDRLMAHKSGQNPFEDEGAFVAYKNRFQGFLKSSSQYSPAKMLDRLPRDDPDFYEARAIAFSKMGKHRQALEIYVFKMGDHRKAEEYVPFCSSLIVLIC